MSRIRIKKIKIDLSIYLVAVIANIIVLAMVTGFHKITPSIPLNYGGDSIDVLAEVKGHIHEDKVRNLFAPFEIDHEKSATREILVFPFRSFFVQTVKIFSLLTKNVALIVNSYFILTFILTPFAVVFVLRHYRIDPVICVLCSLAFNFLPYHFMRGISHLTMASYFYIPLHVLILLWTWSARQVFLNRDNGRYTFSLFNYKAVCSIVLIFLFSSNPYYVLFFAYLLFVSGISASYHRKTNLPMLNVSILLLFIVLSYYKGAMIHVIDSVTGLGFDASLLSNFWNTQAIAQLGEEETFGLKIAQLLLPVDGHRISWLADLKRLYNSTHPLVNENSTASLGVVGAAGFIILVFNLLTHGANGKSVISKLSILNVFALLLATIGGGYAFVKMIMSTFMAPSSPFIVARSFNRISVYIAFFSLLAVSFLLNGVKRNLFSKPGALKHALFYFALALIFSIQLYDATTVHFDFTRIRNVRKPYLSDHAFFSKIENTAPEKARIFQLPFSFHHGDTNHKSWYSDNYRGYIHTTSLKWTFGGDYGTRQFAWFKSISGEPLDKMLKYLSATGYSGILIDGFGYADNASKLRNELKSVLNTDPIVNGNSRYCYFDITQYRDRLNSEISPDQLAARAERVLNPVIVRWEDGFYFREKSPDRKSWWRWTSGKGVLALENTTDLERDFILNLSLGWQGAAGVTTIDGPGFSDSIRVPAKISVPYEKRIVIPPRSVVDITFSSTAPPHGGAASRKIVFAVIEFSFNETIP